MTRTLLALSPHLDDAVFSAGGALAARAADGWAVTVATLFTGNVAQPQGFALACQLDKGIDPAVDYMALRREEDHNACCILGVEAALHLPLLEAPHRGYGDATALFRPPCLDDGIAPQLVLTINTLLSKVTPDEVWAPRAVGGHVDHVLVHRALRDCVTADKVRWWTDWPYVDRAAPADPEAATVQECAWIDEPLTAMNQAKKANACAAYRSQLDFQFGGEACMRKRLGAITAERFAVSMP